MPLDDLQVRNSIDDLQAWNFIDDQQAWNSIDDSRWFTSYKLKAPSTICKLNSSIDDLHAQNSNCLLLSELHWRSISLKVHWRVKTLHWWNLRSSSNLANLISFKIISNIFLWWHWGFIFRIYLFWGRLILGCGRCLSMHGRSLYVLGKYIICLVDLSIFILKHELLMINLITLWYVLCLL